MKRLAVAAFICFAGYAPGFADPEPGDAPTDASEASARFDYHTVRGRQSTVRASGVFEGEVLKLQGKSRLQGMRGFGSGWSGDAHLLWDGLVGESMETSFRVASTGRYRLSVQLTKAPDYGVFSVHFNGNEIRKDVDLYDGKVKLAEMLDLGEFALDAGDQRLSFKLTGANESARKFRGKGYLMGLDFLRLVRLDPPDTNPKRERGKSQQGPSLARRVSDAAAPNVDFAEARSVMAEYCFRCHGGEKVEGKVNLKQLASKADFLSNIAVTRKVAQVLDQNEMPPEDQRQPPQAKRAQLAALFKSLIDEHLKTSITLPPIVMRRLNRYEYNNAVRDLLKLKGDIYPLPEKVIRPGRRYFNPASGHFPDSILVGNRSLGKNQIEKPILTGVVPFAIDLQAEHGFNNRGDELSVSPILLESFLKLGRNIVNSPQFDGYCQLTPSLLHVPDDRSRDQQVELASQRIRTLLERAFRAPVDDATAKRYERFFARELERTKSFSQSMKNVLAAVLASPRFIYVTEVKAVAPSKVRPTKQAGRDKTLGAGSDDEPVSAYELASRLSLFIWSSIPDEELLTRAGDGQLLKPEVLEAQVRRMLEDPRSKALSDNFARQWLRLDQLITAVPDFERFEVYYSRIGCEQWKFGLQMMVEPLLLFESIMVEDRSIMLLVDSNYSYRSDELQSWYKDKTPFGKRANRNRFNTFQQEYRRRNLDTRREGGMITSAATLTMTSAPLRTSPITRGAWVATVVFNQPPPPPPDVIPQIEADDAAIEAKGLTLRERLKQHQVNQACVSCHSKIDSLGFALENYDAVGRWREKYRSGLAIDSSGHLFGKAKFTDIIGLKNEILNHPDWFMRAFSQHLLSYALGRELKLSDKPAVDRIVQKVMADRGQFSTVVQSIATSYPFLHKSRPEQAPRSSGKVRATE